MFNIVSKIVAWLQVPVHKIVLLLADFRIVSGGLVYHVTFCSHLHYCKATKISFTCTQHLRRNAKTKFTCSTYFSPNHIISLLVSCVPLTCITIHEMTTLLSIAELNPEFMMD